MITLATEEQKQKTSEKMQDPLEKKSYLSSVHVGQVLIDWVGGWLAWRNIYRTLRGETKEVRDNFVLVFWECLSGVC